jgi:hypothetical protein
MHGFWFRVDELGMLADVVSATVTEYKRAQRHSKRRHDFAAGDFRRPQQAGHPNGTRPVLRLSTQECALRFQERFQRSDMHFRSL